MACILLIDDDREVRETLKAVLEAADHRVVEAPNGVIGLERLKSESAQLVITDILMPEKEGVETIIEMRRTQPRLPIIAISGGGAIRNLAFLDIARKLGADSILSKPVEVEALLDKVAALLPQGKGDGGGKQGRGNSGHRG